MRSFSIFIFTFILVADIFSQPIARVEKEGEEKEIILEKYISEVWLKTADKKRYAGFLLDFTGEEFILLDFTGSQSGIGMSEKKKKLKEIDSSSSMDERTKHIEMLKLYYTDTVRVPYNLVRKLEAEKPFYKEHKKWVPILGITGAGLLIASGLLTNLKNEDLEVPLTVSASIGAGMIITAGVINRHYKVKLGPEKWKVSKLK